MGFGQHVECDAIQHRAIRFFLGVHRFAPIHAVTGDTGWDPCITRRHTNMLRYWNRVVRLDEHRLTRKILMWDFALNTKNWSAEICSIFENLNLEIEDLFRIDITASRLKLRSDYETKWLQAMQQKPKLRTYVLFKNNYKLESYVSSNLTRSQRSFLAQLRSGVLPLRVETGRFQNEQLENRLCVFCESMSIEDEYHFLLHCDLYDDLRRHLFYSLVDNVFHISSDSEKIKLLLHNNFKQVAQFVEKAFLRRRDKLYS